MWFTENRQGAETMVGLKTSYHPYTWLLGPCPVEGLADVESLGSQGNSHCNLCLRCPRSCPHTQDLRSVPLAPRTSEVHALTVLNLLLGPWGPLVWVTLLRVEPITNSTFLGQGQLRHSLGHQEGWNFRVPLEVSPSPREKKALRCGAGSGEERVACSPHLLFCPDPKRLGVGCSKPLWKKLHHKNFSCFMLCDSTWLIPVGLLQAGDHHGRVSAQGRASWHSPASVPHHWWRWKGDCLAWKHLRCGFWWRVQSCTLIFIPTKPCPTTTNQLERIFV